MWSHPEIVETLRKSCGIESLITYPGKPPPTHGIVGTYNQALKNIDADFFLFCHQDVAGDIPAFIEASLKFMGPKDVVGAIGKTEKNTPVWRHNEAPIEVETLDECCFGFYKNSGYTFDPKLLWTNYSQDICLLAKSKGGKVWVPPHNIGHAQHRWGSWFKTQGYFGKERAYLSKKWGPFHRS
ncbi:hypothetical protein ES703_59364 [subsurface metagenome]